MMLVRRCVRVSIKDFDGNGVKSSSRPNSLSLYLRCLELRFSRALHIRETVSLAWLYLCKTVEPSHRRRRWIVEDGIVCHSL